MNGPQDLGGQMGFGPVAPEDQHTEPLFHHDWEARALALNLAAGALGHWNIDTSRFTRESLPPAVYLASSYYEIWTRGLERLVAQAGLVGDDELAAGRSLHPPAATRRSPMTAEAVEPAFTARVPYTRETTTTPRFAAGDRVRTVNDHPSGHTRLPRYARGRFGRSKRSAAAWCSRTRTHTATAPIRSGATRSRSMRWSSGAAPPTRARS